ncbi:MAG: sugar phosphate isomerase/epimerase family protein [Nitrososphaerales archaeon]
MQETLVLSGLYRWYQKYVFRDRIPEVEKNFVNLNTFEEHYRDILVSLASSGFDGIEGFFELPGLHGSTKSLKMLLQEFNLRMPIAYVNSLLHDPKNSEKSIEAILTQVRTVIDAGMQYLDINPEPSDHEKTEKEIIWETDALRKLSKGLKDMGAVTTLHYHDEMMRQDAAELRFILENTDPDLVKLTLDFHWAYRAGVDPMELLDQYFSRIVALHLRNSMNGVWTEAFGEGEVDYKRAAKMLKQSNWRGLIVVELANEKGMTRKHSVEMNHKISRDYVIEVFGA